MPSSMRWILMGIAVLAAFIIGTMSVPEPLRRVDVESVGVTPSRPSGLINESPEALRLRHPFPIRTRVTLEDVARSWGIEGRLVCHAE